ncbi:MAG: hypothetical protein ACREQ5_35485 [Candidatus Dormibacteria bacterium]
MGATNGVSYAPEPGKIPGTALNLGGHDFIVAPLNLNQLQHFKDLLEQPVGGSSLEAIERSLPLVVAAIQRNNPNFTMDAARELVDFGNFPAVLQAVLSSSGLVRVGERKPAAT